MAVSLWQCATAVLGSQGCTTSFSDCQNHKYFIKSQGLTYRIVGSFSDYHLYFSLAICIYFHCKKKGKIKCWKCLHTFLLTGVSWWNSGFHKLLLCICGIWDSAQGGPTGTTLPWKALPPPLSGSSGGSADFSLSKSLWLGRKHCTVPLGWAEQACDNFYSCVLSKIFLIFKNIQS